MRQTDGRLGAPDSTRPHAPANEGGGTSSSRGTIPGASSMALPPVGRAWRPSDRRWVRHRVPLALAGVALLAMTGVLAGQAKTPAPPGAKPALKFAVVSFYNPRLMYLKYQPLVDYLSAHTPWHFELDLSPSYRETVVRLCEGRVQLAYLGPFSFVRAREMCKVKPVVQLKSEGRATYTSYIMVREDSPIHSLAALRGQTFAYGAVLSTSSHLMPRFMLQQAGLESGRDIKCRYYGHHERAARAVLTGEAAACGVRDLVGDQFTGRGLRILAKSEPMTNFPLVVGPRVPAGLEAALTDALLRLPPRDAEAAREIASWDPELSGGFAAVSADAYQPIADLARRLFGPKALTAPPDSLTCGPGR
jgi:phosphonate transport system substrate-binding protein